MSAENSSSSASLRSTKEEPGSDSSVARVCGIVQWLQEPLSYDQLTSSYEVAADFSFRLG